MTSCTCFNVAASCSARPVQRLTITTVQCERDTQYLTEELEPVRASSLIAFFHGHSAGMCPFRLRYGGFVLKQQRILAQDLVNTFGIDRRYTIKFCPSAKQLPYPTIIIRGQLSDNMMYTEKHIRIIRVMTAASSFQPLIRLRMTCNCARDTRRQQLTQLTLHPRAIRARALSTILLAHIQRLL